MMKELNRRLFYHLDDLREDAGITINEFCEGVCDRRQYSRYKNGRQEVSLKNISKFYRKLGFSEIEFYYSFYNSDLSEYPKLNKLYYSLVSRDMKTAKEYIKELRDVEFVGVRTRRYFEFELIYYNYIDKQVSFAHSLEMLKRLINYENCIQKKYFDFIDIASLRLIMIIEMKNNEMNTLDLLYKLLVGDRYVYVTSESRNILPSIYASVARQYGMLGDHFKVIEICTLGIDYSISINNMHLLDNLFYYKSFAFLSLKQNIQSYKYGRKALSVLFTNGDMKKAMKMKKVLDKDFGFDSLELFRSVEI